MVRPGGQNHPYVQSICLVSGPCGIPCFSSVKLRKDTQLMIHYRANQCKHCLMSFQVCTVEDRKQTFDAQKCFCQQASHLLNNPYALTSSNVSVLWCHLFITGHKLDFALWLISVQGTWNKAKKSLSSIGKCSHTQKKYSVMTSHLGYTLKHWSIGVAKSMGFA